MKKIVLGLLAASLLASPLSSCNNKLNVTPIDSIDAGQALNTPDDVQAALIGSYTSLQASEAYNGYIQLMSDLLADNGDFTFVGSFSQPQEFQRKALRRDNSFVQAIWQRGYITVNRTNNVLANLDKVTNAASKTRIEAEAKFIRSLTYFDLVRLFARDWNDGTPASNPGVPLVLTPTTTVTDANNVSRNTVAEVYTLLITDLTTAEAQLPVDNSFFATKSAAAALLSRIYLQQSRFAEAAAAANRALNYPRTQTPYPFALVGDYASEFYQGGDLVTTTSEDVFTVQNSAQSGSNSGSNQLNVFYSQSQRGDISVNEQLLNQFEASDDRANLFSVANGQTYSDKYDGQYGTVKVIRLAELYLTRAEGNFRAGTTVGATPLSDVNRVRARAGLPALTTVTLAAILKERKLELVFEGFRLGDLKRNKESTIDPITNATIPWNSPRLVLPIPLSEINRNPNLVQNAGY